MKSNPHVVVVATVALLVCSVPSRAQASLDGLQRELQELRTEREKEMNAGLQTLLTRLSTASTNPEEARVLLKECGYIPQDEADPAKPRRPRRAPANLAEKRDQDAQSSASDSIDLGLARHCSMIYAGLSVNNLRESERSKFIQGWINTMVSDYGSYRGQDIAKVKGPDSPIAKHFGIGYLLEGSEIGKGNLRSLPGLYKRFILEPLRTPLKPEVIGAWDGYIGLKQTEDGENPDTQLVEVPELQFLRGQDAFTLAPTEAAVAAQLQILKTYREHPKFNEFAQIVQEDIKTLRSGKSATPPTP